MSSALAELYVVLSVQTGELTAGFARAAAAGEEFQAKIAETMAVVDDSARSAAGAEADLATAGQAATDSAYSAATAYDALRANLLGAGDAAVIAAGHEDELAAAEARAGDAAATSAGKQDTASAATGRARHHVGLLALGMAAGAVAAVKMAGDFQQSMTRLVTSAGETRKNIGLVSKGILNLSVSTNTSTKQLAAGMYTVESAGFHGAQGLTVLKAAAQGAQAEGANLSTVSNAVTSGLNAYGLSASHAMAFTNEMVTAVGRGKMTMQDLAGRWRRSCP